MTAVQSSKRRHIQYGCNMCKWCDIITHTKEVNEAIETFRYHNIAQHSGKATICWVTGSKIIGEK